MQRTPKSKLNIYLQYSTGVKHGNTFKAYWLFNNLRLGESKHLDGIYYVNGQACYLSGSKIKDKDGKPELQIPEEERKKVKEVTMDLSESMRSIIEAAFPDATITLDCFHIMKRCLEAVEEFRPPVLSNGDTLVELLTRSKHALTQTHDNSKLKAFRAQLRGIRDLPFFIFRICKVFG